MPLFTIDLQNAALGAISIGQLSLHTAYDPAGAFEVVGGTPAYQRLFPSFNPPTDGQITLAGGPYAFDVPAGTVVPWLGLWTADNTFYGMLPCGLQRPTWFITNPSDPTELLVPSIAFELFSQVVFWTAQVRRATFPQNVDFTALVEGTLYYVVGVTDNGIQVAGNVTDPPFSFITKGSGYVQPIQPVSFDTQGQLAVFNVIIDALDGA